MGTACVQQTTDHFNQLRILVAVPFRLNHLPVAVPDLLVILIEQAPCMLSEGSATVQPDDPSRVGPVGDGRKQSAAFVVVDGPKESAKTPLSRFLQTIGDRKAPACEFDPLTSTRGYTVPASLQRQWVRRSWPGAR